MQSHILSLRAVTIVLYITSRIDVRALACLWTRTWNVTPTTIMDHPDKHTSSRPQTPLPPPSSTSQRTHRTRHTPQTPLKNRHTHTPQPTRCQLPLLRGIRHLRSKFHRPQIRIHLIHYLIARNLLCKLMPKSWCQRRTRSETIHQ